MHEVHITPRLLEELANQLQMDVEIELKEQKVSKQQIMQFDTAKQEAKRYRLHSL